MYTHRSIDDVGPQEIEGIEPSLRAIGYELRPAEMRPSVWEYAAGESNNRHRQGEQEELYVVLSGRFEMEVDGETIELAEGDAVVVSPDAWRQLIAREDSRLLAVGAPNVADDGIVYEE
ncbi:cupin domain protein [Halalkalicoccus paucihalophilus]|uniref:Cupin domain protein n=1 Tax=Halalkalicoccus paucihalophilus TaxID=1008153 RepID=A0A151ACV1_9EURY|nr:cupin domain-containing protein [Halalkalicoccus paucihalophilus]KYH25521.1 cupin domain protein [Halalkalicoccus paucihalophilus]